MMTDLDHVELKIAVLVCIFYGYRQCALITYNSSVRNLKLPRLNLCKRVAEWSPAGSARQSGLSEGKMGTAFCELRGCSEILAVSRLI